MRFTTSPAEKSTVVLEVELPPDRLDRSINQSLQHLGRRTRVPGFRPGKVPRPMLERALGVRRDDPAAPNPVYDDAKEHLFEASVIEALREADIDVIALGKPEWLRFEEGIGATYRVTLPVRPEVTLGAYAEYPFRLEIDEIDDAKVDQVLEQLRDQQATLVPVEGRAAQQGDYAVISFVGRRDGEEFEGGSSERMPLVIGSERMIPGFEDQLVGLTEGEQKTFAIRFPDDYPEASLAGQMVDFDVTLRELRTKSLPDLDDDFAASVGTYPDLATLREEVRRRLERNARDRARHGFSERIIEFATANASVEIPDLLIDREVEVMHDELRLRLSEQRIAYEEYLRVTGKDETGLHAEYREPAEQRVKTLLVLTAVAEAEGVEVDDAEVDAEIERARERYTENPRLVAYFESPRGRSYLGSTLRRTKTVEMLVDRWLDAHPEVGPVPHLEDENAAPSQSVSNLPELAAPEGTRS